jgi:hypothetical protein
MSQAQRSKSEFLGLHDPYGDDAPGASAAPRIRPSGPLLDQEKKAELVRAGASLLVLVVSVAVVATALF